MSSLLELSTSQLTAWIGQWWWPFVRIGATFWVLPFYGDGRITPSLRLGLTLAVSMLVAPLMKGMPAFNPVSITTLLLTVEQLVFGLLFGMCVQLLFNVMTTAGQILSMQMGLSMAIMNDPVNGDSAPLISQLMLIFCTLLFLGLNGHLVVLDILVNSLHAWPPGSSVAQLNLGGVVGLLGWSIGAALILTLPAVVAMLIVNLTFGVMSRSAPSLNIFSLGFPMTLLLGLVTMALSISGVPSRYADLVEFVLSVLTGLSHQ